jgi:hypothetical protein
VNGVKIGFWMVVAVVGYVIFRTEVSPVNLLVGVPFIGIGLGMVINFLWTDVLVITSRRFNMGTCKICMRQRLHSYQSE